MRTLAAFVLALPVSITLAASAQDDAATGDEANGGIRVTLGGRVVHQFDTDLDDGGDYNVTRGGAHVGLGFDLSAALTLDLGFGYGYDGYSFGGDSGLGALDPWDDVHTFLASARLNWKANEQWTIFGGALVADSAESGADESSFTGGGTVGAVYHASDVFSIGGGLGVMSRIEDSAAVFPIIVLNWKISDEWTLRSAAEFGASGAAGGGAIELAWQFDPAWELALIAAYESRRFRLDDSGAAPDGVGEERTLPIMLQLSYEPQANTSLSLFAGLIASGELNLDDDDGDKIMDDDLDGSGAVIGARVSVRF